ncbi:hypothetical protein DPMN_019991 [Dreissena polymorpha]|uniref:Uncharacterized protein n=1 Tax=Dreissena polymorpha TaxID=45954 RepID=A0A9D4NLD9_DREPO|nr:hypothetical protein DPMN_019991 [Dreissena polymorpha]
MFSIFVGLYDFGRLEYRAVRKLLQQEAGVAQFYRGDNRSVVMRLHRKVYLFDLEKMDVCIVFPGIVSEESVFCVTERKRTYNRTHYCLHFAIELRSGKNVN